MLIVMENHEYGDIVDSPEAPYINHTLIPSGTLFTNYDAVSHPSLPNYLAMTSGSTRGKTATDSIVPGEIHAENLFHQLSRARIVWRAYEEALTSSCDRSIFAGNAPGSYALKHDPAMAYADVAGTSLCHLVVPLTDLRAPHLPPFSFVTPDECHDMHSCAVATGDAWLRQQVPPLLRSGAIVIVTFDEGSTDVGGGGRVLTMEIGPGVSRGVRVGTPLDHYSLLAGLERHFALARLGNARTARPLAI